MKIAGYEYQSCFGPYIQQFLQEKRDAGFIYESEEWIMQSKGRKDRMVYLSEDLTELLREYVFKLSSVFLCQSVWFFPARNPEQQLSNVTIDKRFRDSWAKTPFAKNCDRNPTVHCLRHSFVVKRMNLWMEEGVPLKEMLPFLSKFLGHTSPEETLYYYHQVDSA